MLNLRLSKAIPISFFLLLQVLPAQETGDPYQCLEKIESESALNWVKLHNGITEET